MPIAFFDVDTQKRSVSAAGAPPIVFRFAGDTCEAELDGISLVAKLGHDCSIAVLVHTYQHEVFASFDLRPSQTMEPARSLMEVGSALIWSHWRRKRADDGQAAPAQSRDDAMVVVDRPLADGGPFRCDPEIAPLVRALNAAGIFTLASCSGHGHRPGNIALADGRELVIARNYEEGRRIDELFPVDINGLTMDERLAAQKRWDAAMAKPWADPVFVPGKPQGESPEAAAPADPFPDERRFLASPNRHEMCCLCGKHIRHHFGGTDYRCEPRVPLNAGSSKEPPSSALEDAARAAGVLVSIVHLRDEVNAKSGGAPSTDLIISTLIEHLNAALVKLYGVARRG